MRVCAGKDQRCIMAVERNRFAMVCDRGLVAAIGGRNDCRFPV